MIKLHYNQRLKELGWKLLLQIHDEVILEGSEASAEEALAVAKDILEHPLDEELRVALEVDAKIASNWYAAK
jgi:DNA polymerase-1